MTLPAPAHVYQLDGSAWGPSACMAAAGAMAMDAYTGGTIRPTIAQLRANQDDQSGGIGLDDLATAWQRGWGLPFVVASPAWPTIRDRLSRGDGVVITANYGALGWWRAPGSTFRGAHALYLARLEGARGIVVHDPLRRGPVVIPADTVRAAYTGGAGWGRGTYAGTPGGSRLGAFGDLVSFPVGHVLTAADIDLIMAKLDGAGWFASDPTGLARSTVRTILRAHIGDPWTKALQDQLQAELSGAATAANPLGPAVGTLVSGVGDALTRAGLVAGLIALALLGVWLVFREPAIIPAPVGRILRR